MARVKRGVVSKRKHNKLADLTKGYRGTKSRLVKAVSLQKATEAQNTGLLKWQPRPRFMPELMLIMEEKLKREIFGRCG